MYCHTEEQVSGSVYFISSVLCILSYLKINKGIWEDGSVVKALSQIPQNPHKCGVGMVTYL